MFILSMFMLIFPKFLGLIIYLKENRGQDIGGFFGAVKSVLAEIVFSALSAPIMMMFQSKFVFDIFAGIDAGWNTQNREESGTPFRQALQRHFWHTALGLATTVIVWRYAHSLFWWMLPITVGLMLSIPISIFSSRETSGIGARRHKFFIIPEEIQIPEILQEAKSYLLQLQQVPVYSCNIEAVVADSRLNALHILMLPVNGPTPEFSNKALEMAQIKLENFINHQLKLELSKDEEIALLYSPDILRKANLAMTCSAGARRVCC